jgi:hypothetical protein
MPRPTIVRPSDVTVGAARKFTCISWRNFVVHEPSTSITDKGIQACEELEPPDYAGR